MAATASIYQDIATRTGGDIYIGIVGPVRTGKSTFIKRFMEALVIPNIENVYMKERAKDELPQSGSGRTIMTAEPKFVPEDAVEITVEGGVSFSVRLIDSVGYMVDGAIGQYEGDSERKVTTPWYDHDITMKEAAEFGTRKVITEHSTIGIVVTTDGTVTDISRENYEEPEERVVNELKAMGKPFLILLNSATPTSPETTALAESLSEKYGVTTVVRDCMTLDVEDITDILKAVLYEFPISEFGFYLPSWVDALEASHPIKSLLYSAIRESADSIDKISDVSGIVEKLSVQETVETAEIRDISLGTGKASISIGLARELFYATISERSGFDIRDDGVLLSLLSELSDVKRDYDKIAPALKAVREKGYGIVLPSRDELKLQEPEIVKQGGRYGVKLKASAPSIHMIMANVETEVSPAVGGEKSSSDIINYLLQEFEGDTGKIWESNIFGKSLNDIAGEGLSAKIKRMPEEAQGKLQETLQRIINEGSNGLICIIL
ncbi:MAG: stage IV sporulation protein A [Oscillospiraceae bacterium]|nr:stage IV sporulation protein A [Oscillospiraceae bacterium]